MQGQDLGSDHWLDGGLLDLNFLGDTITHLDRTREWSQQYNHPLVPSGHNSPQNLDNWQILEHGDRHFDFPDNGAPSSSGQNNFQDRAEFPALYAKNSSIRPVVECLGNFKHVNTKSKLVDPKQETCNGQQYSNTDTWQAVSDDDIFEDGGFHSNLHFATIYKRNPCVNARSTSSLSDVIGAEIDRKSLSEKEIDFKQWGSAGLEEWDSEMTSYSEGTSFFSGVDGDSCIDSDTMSNLSKSIENFPRSAALQEMHSTWKRDVQDNLDQTSNYVGQWSQGFNFMSPRCKSVDSSVGVFQEASTHDDFYTSFSTSTSNAKGHDLNSGSWNDGSNFLEPHPGTFFQGEFSGKPSSREGVGKADYNTSFDASQRCPPSVGVTNLSRKLDEKAPRRSRHQSLPDKGSNNIFSSPATLSMIPNFNGSCSFDKNSSDELATAVMDAQMNGGQGHTNTLSVSVSPVTMESSKYERSKAQSTFHGPSTSGMIPPNPYDINMVTVQNELRHSMLNELTSLPLTKFNSGTNYAIAQMQNDTSQLYDGTKHADSQVCLDKLHEICCLEENLTNLRKAIIPNTANPGFGKEIHPNTSSVPISGELSILKNLLKNGPTVTKRDGNPPQGFLENLLPPEMELPSTSDGIAMIPSTSSDDHNQSQAPEAQGAQLKLHREPLKGEEVLDDHLDESLKEAFHESARTGKMTPIIKQELRMKIMYNRCRQGKGDIKDDSTPKPVFELTPEEKEKHKKKLERNRLAASRCRKRKQVQKQKKEQELKDEEDKNALLKEKVESLSAMKYWYLINLLKKGILKPSSIPPYFLDSTKQ